MIRRVQSALGERSFPAELLFARRLRGRACLGFREVATLPLGKVEEQLRQLMEEEVGLRLEPARREEGVLVFDELAPWRVEGGWGCQGPGRGYGDDGQRGCGAHSAVCRMGDSLARFPTVWAMDSTPTWRAPEPWNCSGYACRPGYTVEQTLTAVNGMMLSANQGEEYATVDLLVLDPWLGRAELHKLGACYSVLVCGGRETLLEGAALPLGYPGGSGAPEHQLPSGGRAAAFPDERRHHRCAGGKRAAGCMPALRRGNHGGGRRGGTAAMRPECRGRLSP